MAIVNNDAERIKLSLANLNDYDKLIKSWVVGKIGEGKGIVFAEKANFPAIGDTNVLYVDNDKLYRWDESTQDYILINSVHTGEDSLTWETF